MGDLLESYGQFRNQEKWFTATENHLETLQYRRVRTSERSMPYCLYRAARSFIPATRRKAAGARGSEAKSATWNLRRRSIAAV